MIVVSCGPHGQDRSFGGAHIEHLDLVELDAVDRDHAADELVAQALWATEHDATFAGEHEVDAAVLGDRQMVERILDLIR